MLSRAINHLIDSSVCDNWFRNTKKKMEYAFKTQPWLYAGDSAWVFASVPAKYYEEIKLTASSNRGFGAVRVNASCNNVKWQTSIFPDSKTKTYLRLFFAVSGAARTLHRLLLFLHLLRMLHQCCVVLIVEVAMMMAQEQIGGVAVLAVVVAVVVEVVVVVVVVVVAVAVAAVLVAVAVMMATELVVAL